MRVSVFEIMDHSLYGSVHRLISKNRVSFRDQKARDTISDGQLVKFGMRPPLLHIDQNVFSKSEVEKRELKKAKATHNDVLKKAGYLPGEKLNL